MKRDLEALSKQSKETVRESPSKFRLSSRGLSRKSPMAGPSRVYEAICIFFVIKNRSTRKIREQRKHLLSVLSFEVMMTEDDKSYEDVENEAFKTLSDWIRLNIFPARSVISMSELLEQHICIMNSLGVTEIKRSTQTHFRRKLETEFGDAISIKHDDRGKLLVMSSTITVCDLAKTNQRLSRELNEKKGH